MGNKQSANERNFARSQTFVDNILSCSTQDIQHAFDYDFNIKCCDYSDTDSITTLISHETKKSSWLPPMQLWNIGQNDLPYGWELAFDSQHKPYYINHLNKTTTYENPKQDTFYCRPEPRTVELQRDFVYGFGFVAGSEKPVLVRSVKEAGPALNKLLPGDQILEINGEDVQKAPQDYVIQLVKSCKDLLVLTICQPHTNNAIRKSALLTAAKKAKLKDRPCRVRFAENLSLSDNSPLFSQNGADNNTINLQNLPNILKVYLENGQTKTFKYDPHTTVKDVIDSLIDKLSIKLRKHFALCIEYVKTMRSNKLSVLDPKETIAKIAARPGAHNLRCVFRFSYLPVDFDFLSLYQKDAAAFQYLYSQSTSDLLYDYPHGSAEIPLRLVALRIQQLFLMSAENSTQAAIQQNHPNAKEKNNSKNSINTKLLKNSDILFLRNSSNSSNQTTTSSSADINFDTAHVTGEQALANAKKCVKQIEHAYGLENIVPVVFVKSMKRKDLIKMLVHFYKLNQTQIVSFVASQFTKSNTLESTNLNLTSCSSVSTDKSDLSSTTNDKDINTLNTNLLTTFSLLNATSTKKPADLKRIVITEDIIKLCFLNLMSELQTFGVKMFALKETSLSFRKINNVNTSNKEPNSNGITGLSSYFSNSLDSAVWLSPKLGICHVTKNLLGQPSPFNLAKINQIAAIRVTRHEECDLDVELNFKILLCSDELANSLHFIMDEKDAKEFLICLNAFYSLIICSNDTNDLEKEIPLFWDVTNSWWTDSAPNYFGEHMVKPVVWNYPINYPFNNNASLFTFNQNVHIDNSHSTKNANDVDLNELFEELRSIDLMIPPPTYTENFNLNFNSINNVESCNSNTNKVQWTNSNNVNINNVNNDYINEYNEIDTKLLNNNCCIQTSYNLTSNSNNNNLVINNNKLNQLNTICKSNDINKLILNQNTDNTITSFDSSLNNDYLIISSLKNQNNSLINSINVQDKNASKNESEQKDSLESNTNSINGADSSTDILMPGQLKATDSLLLLTQLDQESIIGKETLNTDDISFCESDTDSNETPTISDTYTQNSETLTDNNSLVIEINKDELLLRNNLNDLTVINEFDRMKNCDEMMEANPNIIVSSNETCFTKINRNKNIESSFGYHSIEEKNFAEVETNLNNSNSLSNQQESGKFLLINENNNELGDIIDLTVISPPPTPENELSTFNFHHLSNLNENYDYDVYVQEQNQPDSEFISSNNIEDFIASVSIGTPPKQNQLNFDLSNENKEEYNLKNVTNLNTDKNDILLNLMIVPPPPSIESNFVKQQDEILNRFHKATEDIKKICDLNNVGNCKNDIDYANNSHLIRDLHSSSSGDSGYDSVMINNNSIQLNSIQKYDEKLFSNEQNDLNTNSCNHNDLIESSSCDDLYLTNSNNNLNISKLNTILIDLLINQNNYAYQVLNSNQEKTINNYENLNSLSKLDYKRLNRVNSWTNFQNQDELYQIESNLSDLNLKPPKAPPRQRYLNANSLSLFKNNELNQKTSSYINNNHLLKLKTLTNHQSVASQIHNTQDTFNLQHAQNVQKTELNLTQTYHSNLNIFHNLNDVDNVSMFEPSKLCAKIDRIDFLNDFLSDDCNNFLKKSHFLMDQLFNELDQTNQNKHESQSTSINDNQIKMSNTDYIKYYEFLVSESLQFVTCSKLFVKSAIEGSNEQITNYLNECVQLLHNMCNCAKIVLDNLLNQEKNVCLTNCLKQVVKTYVQTIQAVHKLKLTTNEQLNNKQNELNIQTNQNFDAQLEQHLTVSSTYMDLLMDNASSLATALSILMKKLRELN